MEEKKNRVLQVQIPEDVIFNILILLPAKSLMRFKCVCKQWKTLISDPDFAKLHYKQSEARPEATCMWFYVRRYSSWTSTQAIFPVNPADGAYSSQLQTYNFRDCFPCTDIVNGMICLCEPRNINDYQLYFLNLTSGQRITLPMPPCIMNSSYRIHHCASFHILCRKKKFKVLFIMHQNNSREISRIMIFTLGTEDWRNLNCSTAGYLGKGTISVNGKIYWKDALYRNGRRVVEFFDFQEEKFSLLEAPEGAGWCGELVAQIGNDVGLVCRKSYRPCVLKVWIYDNEARNWIDEDDLNLGGESICNVEVIGHTRKSSEILITAQKSPCDPVLQLIFYDFETRKFSRPPFELIYPGTSLLCYGVSAAVSNHVENILPLESLGKRKNADKSSAEKAAKKQRVH